MKLFLEGREDDFKAKYKQKFGDATNRIVNLIKPKYLDWVGKHMSTINFDENLLKVSEAIKEFDKMSNNLPLTDINSYKQIDELISAIEKYKNRERRTYEQVQGGNLVYEDDRFYVVNPLNHESSCYYGRGTKWCTAANTDYHFKQYNNEGKLFYIIDKTKDSSDYYYKIAVLKKFDGEVGFWDAKDDRIEIGSVPEYEQLLKKIDSYMELVFAEQLKIWRDKESAKKEKERLYQLRIAQERRRKEEEAADRRADGEWTLDENCPDEGLKAHALLLWLEDTSDISILTNEDTIEIQRIKDEIERLNNEYEQDEETRSDLLDEISDLEEELTELEEKKDVYYIVPDGEHYDMTRFEVIGLEGREYAVGTESEVQSSCREYVDQLIDDIGYGGFSSGFAENYIDKDKVEDWAREFYEDDVRESPESHFDDSDRELSREQEDLIDIKKESISDYQEQIQNLEQMDDEDGEIAEKIEEIREMISELESEIEDIESSPEGDFPESMIDEKVEELVSDATYDPMEFLRTWGLDWENFIDREDFIDGVIEADGYGHTLNSYDGNMDEHEVQGTTYYVMRIN
jgi:hypothetical protein